MIDRLYEAFHRPGTPSYRIVDGVVWFLIVLSITFVFVEGWLDAQLDPTDLTVALPEQTRAVYARALWALDWADFAVLIIFGIEIGLRVALFRPPALQFFNLHPSNRLQVQIRGRIGYCLQPLTMIDIITVAAVVPALRGLRALRLLRLLRTSRFFRYSSPFLSVQRAFQDNALLYSFAVSFVGVVTTLGGFIFWQVERHDNEGISTLGDGMWWAIVTLTTVGFGDIAPVTTLGRVVAAAVMLLGMFTLATFAGIVGNTLLRAVLSIRQEQFRMSNELNHIVICGYDGGSRMLLDALIAEINFDVSGVTILAEGERPGDLPPQFRWVSGDPTKESEMDKVRVQYAAAIIVVGHRSDKPQIADATTIMTVFTVRRFMDKNAPPHKRANRLYIVAEILEEENVDRARAAGADEVIETTRLGFSVLAHAISQPGTAHVMSGIAAPDQPSLFIGKVPEGLGASSFSDIATQLRADASVLLVGFRKYGEQTDHINPPDSASIAQNDALIYLSDKPVLPPA